MNTADELSGAAVLWPPSFTITAHCAMPTSAKELVLSEDIDLTLSTYGRAVGKPAWPLTTCPLVKTLPGGLTTSGADLQDGSLIPLCSGKSAPQPQQLSGQLIPFDPSHTTLKKGDFIKTKLFAGKTKPLHPKGRKPTTGTICPMPDTYNQPFLNTVISIISSIANLVRKATFVPLTI